MLNTCFEILIGLLDVANLVNAFKIGTIWKPEASRVSSSFVLSCHIFILSYPQDLVNKMNADVPASWAKDRAQTSKQLMHFLTDQTVALKSNQNKSLKSVFLLALLDSPSVILSFYFKETEEMKEGVGDKMLLSWTVHLKIRERKCEIYHSEE